MLDILKFIFSSFWIWLGCVIIIASVGDAIAKSVKAFRKKNSRQA